MSIFRLVIFSLIIGVCVPTLAAQIPSNKTPTNFLPGTSEWLDSSANADFPALNLKAGPNPSSALDRILSGDYTLRSDKFILPHSWLRADGDSQVRTCLKMRVYKLARDGPDTDSMHPVSYSTCSPAARFISGQVIHVNGGHYMI